MAGSLLDEEEKMGRPKVFRIFGKTKQTEVHGGLPVFTRSEGEGNLKREKENKKTGSEKEIRSEE